MSLYRDARQPAGTEPAGEDSAKALVSAAQPGLRKTIISRERFGEVFAQHGYRKTFARACALVANRDRAADITQNAWLRAWERLGDLKSANALVPWVGSIAKRGFLSSCNRPQCSQLSENYDRPVDATVTVEAIDIRRALNRIAPQHRQVLVLKYFLDCDTNQISTQLGISTDAVDQRLTRARAALRGILLAAKTERLTAERKPPAQEMSSAFARRRYCS